jgi:hypothetical protein
MKQRIGKPLGNWETVAEQGHFRHKSEFVWHQRDAGKMWPHKGTRIISVMSPLGCPGTPITTV